MDTSTTDSRISATATCVCDVGAEPAGPDFCREMASNNQEETVASVSFVNDACCSDSEIQISSSSAENVLKCSIRPVALNRMLYR
ncbi:unnamed protein product [Protopolystoma xenopodis]|uniref:Uncharacterized protein n=1 Tax=Protopolystoma xenopodis TaxID=117903 RepID=A0A3S5ABZ7_9PLAT|nr:unnamed protein product [Protopolystoma xenopodis]